MKGDVINSYSTGYVKGDQYLGGLVGESHAYKYTNSFWNVETSGMNESKGGTGKSLKEMKSRDTFIEAGWDFEETWGIVQGKTYPYLQWQDPDTYPYSEESS